MLTLVFGSAGDFPVTNEFSKSYCDNQHLLKESPDDQKAMGFDD
jgi:hypothetical protein